MHSRWPYDSIKPAEGVAEELTEVDGCGVVELPAEMLAARRLVRPCVGGAGLGLVDEAKEDVKMEVAEEAADKAKVAPHPTRGSTKEWSEQPPKPPKTHCP